MIENLLLVLLLDRIGNHLSLTSSATYSQRNNDARYEKLDFSYQKACSQLVALTNGR